MRRRGYTLVELLGALSIAGVVALTAAPAIDRLSGARHAALEQEVRRLLSLARAHSVATGQPTGLRIDPVDESLLLVRIASPGAAPSPMPDATGQPAEERRAGEFIRGVEIVSVAGGDGASGAQTLWFGYAGAPEIRDADGDRIADWSQDAMITLSGERAITVRQGTGALE